MPITIDTLIHARWIIPIEPANCVLEHHALAVQDGQIIALLPSAEADRQYQARERLNLPGHALLPGLVNAHTHAAMTLLRGLADDLPLMTWLTEHIWPTEARWVHPDFVRDGTRLAIAEMLRGGTTCFNDMYFFPDTVAATALETGIRASVGLIVIEFPSAWARNARDYLDKGLALHAAIRSEPLLSSVLAPHAPYTVADDSLRAIRDLAERHDLPIHMHVHETAGEVAQSVAQRGQRPLALLDELGLLSPRLLAVHMTQLQPQEIDRLAATGTHVLHCPESNLKLASGFCPTAALLQAGVNVALGTDGAASNNDLDMLAELRLAALLAKAVSGDAAALPAQQALTMATLNGARALGLSDRIGSLVPGKAADVIAVDLSAPETQPVYQPVSQIVYASSRRQVTDVWVAGRRLLQAGELTALDLAAVLERAHAWGRKIAATDAGHNQDQAL